MAPARKAKRQHHGESAHHASPHRRLRTRRRRTHGCPHFTRRLGRLALLAPLRFGRLLRRPGRHARSRPLADPPERRGAHHRQLAPLSRRDADPRDRLRMRDRRRHRGRLHAARQRLVRAGAHRDRQARPRADADGAGAALRLRLLDPLGHAPVARGRHEGDRRPRHGGAAHPGAARGREPAHRRRIHRARRGTRALLARLRALAPAPAAGARAAVDAGAHREPLARMVLALPDPGPLRGRGAALADHAEGARLRADRRHRGRAHHLAARAHRRHPQLGLPLLLAARRHHHPARADARRLLRRGARLARLAGPRDGRLARADPDHVRHRRRAAPARDGARLAARLPGFEAGADRQQRRQPVAARRVRRG